MQNDFHRLPEQHLLDAQNLEEHEERSRSEIKAEEK